MSIMSFYFRLFGSLRSFRLSAYAISLIIILWGSTVVLETIFICMPFSKNWDMKQKGYCLHARELYIAIGAVNISTDILLMGLPVPYILCMRIDLRRKLGIIAMFSLGILYVSPSSLELRANAISNTAVSILRMRAFLNAYNHDITFTMARVFLWTTMDPCVCIIVANLPMVRTYLMIVAPRVFGNTESAVNISNAIQNMRGINRIVVPPERSHLGYTRDWMRDHERREKPFGVEVVISGGRLGREEVWNAGHGFIWWLWLIVRKERFKMSILTKKRCWEGWLGSCCATSLWWLETPDHFHLRVEWVINYRNKQRFPKERTGSI